MYHVSALCATTPEQKRTLNGVLEAIESSRLQEHWVSSCLVECSLVGLTSFSKCSVSLSMKPDILPEGPRSVEVSALFDDSRRAGR